MAKFPGSFLTCWPFTYFARLKSDRAERWLRERRRDGEMDEIVHLLREQLGVSRDILRELRLQRKLTSIQMQFGVPSPQRPPEISQQSWNYLSPSMKRLLGMPNQFNLEGASPTMPTPGPITLLVGQSTTASLLYLDQFGQPMPSSFVPPPVTFAIDNASVATSTPNSDSQTDVVSGIAVGTANLSATLTSAEGLALSISSVITVAAPPPPVPILSSVTLEFTAAS